MKPQVPILELQLFPKADAGVSNLRTKIRRYNRYRPNCVDDFIREKSKFGNEVEKNCYESSEEAEEVDVESDAAIPKDQQMLWPAWVYCTR